MKKLILIVLIIFQMAIVHNAVAVGVGVVPAEIVLNNTARDGHYERQFIVSDLGSGTTNFTISTTGDIAGWAKFYRADNMTAEITYLNISDIKEGELARVIAVFHIPKDVSNGRYEGNIVVSNVPTGTGTQRVIAGVPVAVYITVSGDEVIDGEVRGILTEGDVELGYPLKITTLFYNSGNVISSPTIDVVISQNGTVIDRVSNKGPDVRPGNVTKIDTLWHTTASNLVGDYDAEVTVLLNGSKIAYKSVPFKILEVGSYTRKGSMSNISIDGEPSPGMPLKVTLNFTNEGNAEVFAKPRVELYKGEKLVARQTGDEILVQTNETVPLEVYITPKSEAEYKLVGKVIYGKKETNKMHIYFDTFTEKPENSMPGFIGVYGVIIICILFVIKNTKRL